MRAPRFLWVGDAVQKTGFGTVTHNIVPRLLASGWQGAVCGVNYHGDPHPYPYRIYVADLGGDLWGFERLDELIGKVNPDVVIVNNDPWNVRQFSKALKGSKVACVGYMPVDSPNVPSCRDLNDLRLAIWYTDFGRNEAMASGYTGPSAVVPHGLNAENFSPKPRAECLNRLGIAGQIPEDAFIVGNVNRNSLRKRLDLTVLYFASWWESVGKPENAYLYLHTSNLDSGPNLLQLAVRAGLKRRVLLTNRTMKPGEGIKEDLMPYVYSLFDVQVSTTQGEGWGLTTHEGMGCAVPQLVPEYSALGEWCAGAVAFYPCTSFMVNGHGVNTIGGIGDGFAFGEELTKLYRDPDLRAKLGEVGRARATEPRFEWDNVGALFDAHLRGALHVGDSIDDEALATGGPDAVAVPKQTADPASHEDADAAAIAGEGRRPQTARSKTGPVPIKESATP